MSIATTKKNQQVTAETISTRLDGKKFITKNIKQIKENLFLYLAFYTVTISGISLLVTTTVNLFWLGLTFILLGMAFVLEWKNTELNKDYKNK